MHKYKKVGVCVHKSRHVLKWYNYMVGGILTRQKRFPIFMQIKPLIYRHLRYLCININVKSCVKKYIFLVWIYSK